MEMINKFLDNLEADKQTLVNNLVEKGIEATSDETFTTLVPKVSEIQGGGGDLDWSVIGYDEIPQSLIDDYNYSLEIKNNWDSSITSAQAQFSGNKKITYMPFVNTSNINNFSYMFSNCSSLTYIPLLDTSNGINLICMFNGATKLSTIPPLKIFNAVTMERLFYGCTNLISVPLLDCAKVSTTNNMFDSCTNLVMLEGFLNIGKGYASIKNNNHSYCAIYLTYCTKLTHDSLTNVISNLYDLNLTYDVANGGTLYTQQLVLGSTNMAKLTAEEIAIATNKGWTVS